MCSEWEPGASALRLMAWRRAEFVLVGGAVLVVLVAGVRVVSTYGVFSQTYDEPFHLARGMQWWTSDSYDHVHHPPLAPIFYGLGPLVLSAEFRDTGNRLADGNAVLYGETGYSRTLGAARAGNLVFLCVAAAATFVWGKQIAGPVTGAIAVLLVTLLPPILGHAGLATTDLAITAMLPLAAYAFCVWLDAPSIAKTLIVGICTGLVLLAKFSAVVFLPIALLAVLAARAAANRTSHAPDPPRRRFRRCFWQRSSRR